MLWPNHAALSSRSVSAELRAPESSSDSEAFGVSNLVSPDAADNNPQAVSNGVGLKPKMRAEPATEIRGILHGTRPVRGDGHCARPARTIHGKRDILINSESYFLLLYAPLYAFVCAIIVRMILILHCQKTT